MLVIGEHFIATFKKVNSKNIVVPKENCVSPPILVVAYSMFRHG
jgi:hypothetical protein